MYYFVKRCHNFYTSVKYHFVKRTNTTCTAFYKKDKSHYYKLVSYSLHGNLYLHSGNTSAFPISNSKIQLIRQQQFLKQKKNYCKA